VGDNAAASAEDAFGTSIGNERVGLYSSSEVRGFSPIVANNIRLEGLYMDRPAPFTDRLVEGNTIRVGLTAQNYLFPAPTGIVDYRIRPAGNRPIISTVIGLNSFGGGRVEVDTQIPIVTDRLGVVAGAAVFQDEYASGTDAFLASYAVAARWRPAAGVEVIPFWSRIDTWDREATPVLRPAGAFLPPRVERRLYAGPDWSDTRNMVTHSGVIAKGRWSDWSVAGGLFRTVTESPTNYAQVLAGLTPDGVGNGASPPIRCRSRRRPAASCAPAARSPMGRGGIPCTPRCAVGSGTASLVAAARSASAGRPSKALLTRRGRNSPLESRRARTSTSGLPALPMTGAGRAWAR